MIKKIPWNKCNNSSKQSETHGGNFVDAISVQKKNHGTRLYHVIHNLVVKSLRRPFQNKMFSRHELFHS